MQDLIPMHFNALSVRAGQIVEGNGMRRIGYAAAMLCGLGMGGASVAAERISSLAPLTLPMVAAQAPAPSASPTQNVQTITFCRDKENAFPDSAFNDFSPISDEFLRQIGAHHGHTVEELKLYVVTLVTPPQHGQVRLTDEPSRAWTYAPTKGYTGADRAIYLVEKQGKTYKVIINFWVVEVIDENRQSQVCDSIDFGTSNSSNTTGP